MSGKSFAFAVFLGLSSLIEAANPLSPQAQVPVIVSGNVYTAPVASGTSAGYMICVMDNGNNLQSSFSSNGQLWNAPVLNNYNSYTSTWVAGNTNGFLATFITFVPGYETAAPFAVFTGDDGATWSSEVLIQSSSMIATPVGVSGSSAGFLATWDDSASFNAFSSFSADNGSTWTAATQITTSGLLYGSYPNYIAAVAVSSGASGFVATWLQNDGNGYSSLSTNNGGSWSSPVQITNSGDVNSDVIVSSSPSGYMAVWVNSANNAMTSFSSNGTSWNAPVQAGSGLVANNLTNGSGADVFVSGTTSGFVIAWVGADNNAYGSFSSDNGQTWSTPVQITNDGSVSYSNNASAFGFVSVAAFENGCVFTWQDTSNNVQASFSTITPSSGVQPPSSLAGVQGKNSSPFQTDLFNTLSWAASPSTGVAGYNVYRNGAKIASVTTLEYMDHNQKPGKAAAYAVTAFDGSGNESAAVTVTVN